MKMKELKELDLLYKDLEIVTSRTDTFSTQIDFNDLLAGRPFFVTRSLQYQVKKKSIIFAEWMVNEINRKPSFEEWKLYGRLFSEGFHFYVLANTEIIEVDSINALQENFSKVAIPTPERLTEVMAKKSLSRDEVFILKADFLTRIKVFDFYLEQTSRWFQDPLYVAYFKTLTVKHVEFHSYSLGFKIDEFNDSLMKSKQLGFSVNKLLISDEKVLPILLEMDCCFPELEELGLPKKFSNIQLISWLKNQPKLEKLSGEYSEDLQNLLKNETLLQNLEVIKVNSPASNLFNFNVFLSSIKHFRNLKKLHIRNIGKSEGYDLAFNLENIEELNFIDNFTDEYSRLQLLKKFPNLKKLNFFNWIKKYTGEFELSLGTLFNQLEELSLSGFMPYEDKVLAFWPMLKKLSIKGSKIINIPYISCPLLEEFTIDIGINGKEVFKEKEFIERLSYFPQLKILMLMQSESARPPSEQFFEEIKRRYPRIHINFLGLPKKRIDSENLEFLETDAEVASTDNSSANISTKNAYAPQLDQIAPDSDTVENPNIPQTARELIEGLEVYHYRLGVYQYNSKTCELEKIQPLEKLSVQPRPLGVPKEREGYRYRGQFSLKVIKKETWYEFPSASVNDRLHLVNCLSAEGKFLEAFEVSEKDPNSTLYYIKFKDDFVDVTVQFKVDSQSFPYVQVPNPSEQVVLTDEILKRSWRDPDIIKAIPNPIKLDALVNFCKFTSRVLTLKQNATNAEILEQLIENQAGSCRHRALVFSAFCAQWNIPCRVLQNDIHSFVEVYLDGQWKTIDLGGFRTKLTIEKMELPISADTKPFVRDKKNFDSMATCLTGLEQSSNKPAAVILPESHKKVWTNEIQGVLKNRVMVITPEEIIFNDFVVNGGKISSANSELMNFIHSKEDVYLILDLSNFNASYIPLYTALVDEKKLAQEVLPKNVKVVVLLPEHVFHTMGGDFRSRFKDTTWYGSKYVSASIASEVTLLKTTMIQNYHRCDLYGNSEFMGYLVGTYKVDEKGVLQPVPGSLLMAIQNQKSGLVINHPPESESFQRWLEQVKSQGKFCFNGEIYTIPKNFIIDVENTTYDFSNAYYTLCAGLPPERETTIDLNSGTLELFFEQSQCNNETKKLYLKSGFFKNHPNETVSIWVNEKLPKSLFCKLFEEAKKNNVTICFYGKKEFLNTLESEQTVLPITESSFKTNQFITTNDTDFFWHEYQTKNPNVSQFSPIRINTHTTYEELVGRIAVEKIKNSQEIQLDFTFELGYLAKALLSGEEVILMGAMNPTLAARLSTVWLPEPYLWVNGEKKPVTGKLTVITETLKWESAISPKKISPYSVENFYQLLEERYPIPREALHKLKWAVSEMQELGVHFSYKRLENVFKTLKINPNRNPFKPVLRLETNAEVLIECSRKYFGRQAKKVRRDLNDERLKKLESAFMKNRCVFLVGVTGSGKSYFIERTLKEAYEVFILDDKDPEKTLLAYAKSQSQKPKLLVGDEMNLLHKKILERLTTLEGRILIQGVLYELGSDHYQLLIGNPSHYRGRQASHFFEKIHAIEFKPLSEDRLFSMIAQPLLKEKTTDFRAKYRQKHPDISKKTPRDISYKSLCYLVKQEKLSRFSSEFSAGSTLNGLYITKNWEKPLKKLQMAIDVHRYKLKNAILSGKQGMLIEGDSSLGKTSFIRALLEKNQIDFVDLTGKRIEEIEGLVIEAFHEGKYVLWDEINTVAPLFERLLNHVMSGTDLAKNPPKKAGFYLIGGLNSASGFTGRVPLTDALENRFDKLTITPYSRNEVESILEHKGMDKEEANQLASRFIVGKKLDPTLSLRDIIPDANLGPQL